MQYSQEAVSLEACAALKRPKSRSFGVCGGLDVMLHFLCCRAWLWGCYTLQRVGGVSSGSATRICIAKCSAGPSGAGAVLPFYQQVHCSEPSSSHLAICCLLCALCLALVVHPTAAGAGRWLVLVCSSLQHRVDATSYLPPFVLISACHGLCLWIGLDQESASPVTWGWCACVP